MKKSSSIATSVLLALLTGTMAVLVSLGAAPAGAASPADDEMSQNQAGKYYLDAVCKYNKAQTRYNEVLFPGKSQALSFAEARRRLPALQRASRVWSDANYRFARKLSNPPAAWPASVENPVDRYAARVIKMSNQWQNAAYATSALGWWDWDEKATKLYRSTRMSTVIRSRLDLPPPGRGC